MVTLIKLGGSLITDKTRESTFRQEQTVRIAQEIAQSISARPDLRLIIGHGSGSFGHYAAKKYRTMEGVYTPADWKGFAEVAYAAARLNTFVADTLHDAGLPILRLQPSASTIADNGVITHMNLQLLERAVDNGLIPLIYGDVALDKFRGGTITSTETIFTYIAENTNIERIILVGEVDGVYDNMKRTIPEITPDSFKRIEHFLGQSRGTDVTGGMLTKVSDMLNLVQRIDGLTIHIIDGTKANVLHGTLIQSVHSGTRIHASK